MNRARALQRARKLGWRILPRLPDEPADDRVELLSAGFGALSELDDRSLETWVLALRSQVGGR